MLFDDLYIVNYIFDAGSIPGDYKSFQRTDGSSNP